MRTYAALVTAQFFNIFNNILFIKYKFNISIFIIRKKIKDNLGTQIILNSYVCI